MKRRRTSSNNVAVLDHDTLGSASRARGVHDTCQIISLGWDGLGLVLLAEFLELVKADDLEMWVCAGQGINVLLVGVILGAVNDNLEVLCLFDWVDELR